MHLVTGAGGFLGRPLVERLPPAPRSPYGLSKLEAERLVLETGSRSGMHVCVLRLPLVYGPGLKGNLRAMLDAVARGSFPPPPRGGEGFPGFRLQSRAVWDFWSGGFRGSHTTSSTGSNLSATTTGPI